MKSVVKFLFNNYRGLFYFKIKDKLYRGARAGRIMIPFLILWSGFSIITETNNDFLSTVDIIFLILFIIQGLLTFTKLLDKIYMHLFNLTIDDLKEIDNKRKENANNAPIA